MKASQKNLFVVVVFALIAIQVIGAMALTVQPAKAEAKTIVVPDNYSTIGAGVQNAAPGDTILVRSGTYNENVVIDKAISIVSQEPGGAVVIGQGGLTSGTRAVFKITADGVAIVGFTIRTQTNYSSNSLYATGVILVANNCTLRDNDISNTYYGVFTSYTDGSSFVSNNVTLVGKDGIRICGGSQNVISNNTVDNNGVSGLAIDGYSDMISWNELVANGRGIGLGASYCAFSGNNVTANDGIGVIVGGSSNWVDSNYIADNPSWGVYMSSDFAAPNNNTFFNNNFVNNTQQVYPASQGNVELWNAGTTGNYWSDYNGTDANRDGVGDTPYTVYEANVDAYPLMKQTHPPTGYPPSLPPNTPQPITGPISQWNFDEIGVNGVTPDSLGNNPIVVENYHGVIISPKLVSGVSGNALQFNGSDYAYVGATPTLDIRGEFTVSAWINYPQYKDVEYNLVITECLRGQSGYPTRIWGLAVNGVAPTNSEQPVLGALRGFFLDDKGVLNEIDTTTPINIDEWTQVTFTRSYVTGMHLYINGTEAAVQVTSGVQNSTGIVAYGSEYYIGHDSFSTIDDLAISTTASDQPAHTASPSPMPTPTPEAWALWAQWWFYAAVATAVVALLAGSAWLAKKNIKKP
jgi:nitrous oxidase accessory protein